MCMGGPYKWKCKCMGRAPLLSTFGVRNKGVGKYLKLKCGKCKPSSPSPDICPKLPVWHLPIWNGVDLSGLCAFLPSLMFLFLYLVGPKTANYTIREISLPPTILTMRRGFKSLHPKRKTSGVA